jgi:hypothetical protein
MIELAKTYNQVKAARVYYDPKYNAFFQVKIWHCKSVVIGGFANFYTDAQTCIGRYSMSKGYLKNCIAVPDASLFNKAYPLQDTFHVSGEMDYSWYEHFRALKRQSKLTDDNKDWPNYDYWYDWETDNEDDPISNVKEDSCYDDLYDNPDLKG